MICDEMMTTTAWREYGCKYSLEVSESDKSYGVNDLETRSEIIS